MAPGGAPVNVPRASGLPIDTPSWVARRRGGSCLGAALMQSAALMPAHLGDNEAARRLQAAIEWVYAEGGARWRLRMTKG